MPPSPTCKRARHVQLTPDRKQLMVACTDSSQLDFIDIATRKSVRRNVTISDVGGAVPSSISPRSREVFQEGLLIPPMKLLRAGEMNPDFLTLFLANCRTPDTNLGDIRAMLAALEVGRRCVQAQLVADQAVQANATLSSDLPPNRSEERATIRPPRVR